MPYTSDYPVTAILLEGVKSYLSDISGYNHKYSYEYLDLASYPNNEDYQALVADFLKKKYTDNQPDYIFSMDSM